MASFFRFRKPEDPAPEATPAPAPPPAAAGSAGWRDRLRGSGLARSFGGLFSRNPRLDDDLLDEVETALLTADVGVTATTQLVDGLRKRMKAREFGIPIRYAGIGERPEDLRVFDAEAFVDALLPGNLGS